MFRLRICTPLWSLDSLDFAEVELDTDVYYDYYHTDYEYLEL